MALDTFVEERIRSRGSRLGLIETVIGDSSSTLIAWNGVSFYFKEAENKYSRNVVVGF